VYAQAQQEARYDKQAGATHQDGHDARGLAPWLKIYYVNAFDVYSRCVWPRIYTFPSAADAATHLPRGSGCLRIT